MIISFLKVKSFFESSEKIVDYTAYGPFKNEHVKLPAQRALAGHDL
jgi:hypothetical protein